MARHAHLIGSVGLGNAEEVFTTVSEILGDTCPRIPDGETGPRGYWIRWQVKTFETCADLVAETTTTKLPGYKDAVERTFFKIKEGINPDDIDLGELGYAQEAVQSYAIFKRLKEEGKIGAATKFQISVPTPLALVCGFIVEPDRPAMEGPIERSMTRDVERIQAEIPADEFAIQWDVCYEIIGADGGPQLPYENAIGGSVERIARLCGTIKDDIELGIHLCYGDPGHQHIVEPKDLNISVAFANGICKLAPRHVDFIHMPVPRTRGDDAYLSPLKDLALTDGTDLVLGLVHYTDGAKGTKARIAVAEKFAPSFHIATECGFGRRDPETIPDLLRVHAAVTS